MLRINAAHFVQMGRLFQLVHVYTQNLERPDDPIVALDKEYLTGQLVNLQTHCELLGAIVASKLILKTLEEWVSHEPAGRTLTARRCATDFGSIEDIVDIELGERYFVFIPPQEAAHYDPPDAPFGQNVSERFPSAALDIREAGRAFAVGLDTAAVFHLMRVVEKGLWALATTLSVHFEKASWHNIIEQIESNISQFRKAPATPQRDTDLAFYSEAASEFFYFKDAWRNHVMHNRVAYQHEQADKMLRRVRDFMQHISQKLREPQ